MPRVPDRARAALLASSLLESLKQSAEAGTFAGVILVCAPTWRSHANRVLPECLAGFLARSAPRPLRS